METRDLKETATKLKLPLETVEEEWREVTKQMRKKGDERQFVFHESKLYIFDPKDIRYMDEGFGKLGLMDLALNLNVDPATMRHLLLQLVHERAIEQNMADWYVKARNKPSIKAWFDTPEVMAGDAVSLNIDIYSSNEIDEPRLEVIQPANMELESAPDLPPTIFKGKHCTKYGFKTTKHGSCKVEVKLAGVIDGAFFGPDLLATSSLKIKALPPKISVDVRFSKISAVYLEESVVDLLIKNEGTGQGQDLEIKGLEAHSDFEILGSVETGMIAPHGKIDHPLTLRPKKSGKYTFGDLVLSCRDLDGNIHQSQIPSFEVNVLTPQPRLKVELLPPPNPVNVAEIFSVGGRISNLGDGIAQEISFVLPVEEGILQSGQKEFFHGKKLGQNETIPLSWSLKAREKGELRIPGFPVALHDAEGKALTCECPGAAISVREAGVPSRKEAKSPFTVDSRIGEKYIIIEEVGKGVFGIVYRVKDTMIDEERALKALKASLVNDLNLVDEFIKEAKISMKLRHERIVCVFDVDKEPFAGSTYPYIIMEYLNGGTLEERLQPGKPMAFVESIAVMQDMCAALTYAHQENIIHCDIKPSNIFFDTNTRKWKLGDFGLAKIARKGETFVGSGTYTYQAPEVQSGRSSDKSDIYSLGRVFTEMLTGDPGGNLASVQSLHRKVNAERLETLVGILEKMTAIDPGQRCKLSEVWKVVKWSVTGI